MILDSTSLESITYRNALALEQFIRINHYKGFDPHDVRASIIFTSLIGTTLTIL